MAIRQKDKSKRDKRRVRIRKKVNGTPERPRMTVYRSLKHTYAQLFDDTHGVSLGIVSTKTKSVAALIAEAKSASEAKGKVDGARIVGKELARIAKEKNVTAVVFDRNGYLYHGRVKAVAEGAREGGLQF